METIILTRKPKRGTGENLVGADTRDDGNDANELLPKRHKVAANQPT